jgi:catechol 2,3-dioxygenase-like lactoylglutathione lyase family enzyme
MNDSTQAQTTVNNIGVTMFSVTDQDAALAFYTEKLGYEVRADVPYGESGEMRWLEVAPPGSTARLSLNLPMEGEPGGGSIGVETTDLRGEHARLSELGGVAIGDLMEPPGAPAMFSVRDPDGNYIWVVETP